MVGYLRLLEDEAAYAPDAGQVKVDDWKRAGRARYEHAMLSRMERSIHDGSTLPCGRVRILHAQDALLVAELRLGLEVDTIKVGGRVLLRDALIYGSDGPAAAAPGGEEKDDRKVLSPVHVLAPGLLVELLDHGNGPRPQTDRMRTWSTWRCVEGQRDC